MISILDIKLLDQFLLKFKDNLIESTIPKTKPIINTRVSTLGIEELEVENRSKLQDRSNLSEGLSQDPTQEPQSLSPLRILTLESTLDPSIA